MSRLNALVSLAQRFSAAMENRIVGDEGFDQAITGHFARRSLNAVMTNYGASEAGMILAEGAWSLMPTPALAFLRAGAYADAVRAAMPEQADSIIPKNLPDLKMLTEAAQKFSGAVLALAENSVRGSAVAAYLDAGGRYSERHIAAALGAAECGGAPDANSRAKALSEGSLVAVVSFMRAGIFANAVMVGCGEETARTLIPLQAMGEDNAVVVSCFSSGGFTRLLRP
jgi:hypothetical protein